MNAIKSNNHMHWYVSSERETTYLLPEKHKEVDKEVDRQIQEMLANKII